ncbi:hypothetical protein STIUS_v1c00900 [Spiroplasma sp. TIUS-1]|uniref:RDD family protein n=1 Tax=Spiroplasma sp. TIUS-1 TaxID=216963 RepID=UPI0013982D02|nr:RDD family protein [Spiroplasma sp. TIUS-1]QHX35645.1 hypothetical protein STIUS_v1c00900 [Spiroplasma sp. TIUS-1]
MRNYSNDVPSFLLNKKLVKPFWGRLLAARFFDLFLVSLLQLVVMFCFSNVDSSIVKTIIIIFIQFLMINLYFILIPIFTNGRTLFKFIFGLIVLSDNKTKVGAWKIFTRELVFVIIPIGLFLLTQIIEVVVALKTNATASQVGWIARAGLIIFFGWSIYTLATIYVQADNLAWVDMKNKVRVYRLETIIKKKKVDTKYEIVKDLPLVFNEEDLQLENKDDKNE